MNEIMFLPTSAIPAFMAEETTMGKLRIAVKALAESHRVEYNLDELDYAPEAAEFAEPYAALYGYNVPLIMDTQLLAEYLNKQEGFDAYYIDKSASWNTICICYVPEEQRV